jgi:hypothetical protein
MANNVSGGVGGAAINGPPPLTPPRHSLRSRGEGKLQRQLWSHSTRAAPGVTGS